MSEHAALLVLLKIANAGGQCQTDASVDGGSFDSDGKPDRVCGIWAGVADRSKKVYEKRVDGSITEQRPSWWNDHVETGFSHTP